MKNIKKMFFIMALIMLILGVSTVVSATNDTTSVNTVSESPTDITAVEPQLASATSNKVIKNTTTKEINKKTTDENIKTATKTVEVNNYDELTTTINNAVQDQENNEYIINLNPGTYQITANVQLNSGTYTPNITINANNQTLSGSTTATNLQFNNGCNITINKATITHRTTNQNNKIILNEVTLNNTLTNTVNHKLIIRNSILNAGITNSGTLTIDDNTLVEDKFTLSMVGTGNDCGSIDTDNTNVINLLKSKGIYIKDSAVENIDNTVDIYNYATMTLKNSNNIRIYNYGNLTVLNTTITRSSYNYRNLTIKDSNIKSAIQNRNNMTSINSVFDAAITNSGFLDFINSTDNKGITSTGNLIINNSTYYQINNHNNGNLTLTNTDLSYQTNNNIIYNNGILIITDDVVFSENFKIDGTGVIIYNNPQELVPYLSKYNGNYTLENMTITTMKQNRGNLTIRNTTLNARLDNYGNMTICDDVIFGPNFNLMEFAGCKTIINDTYKIAPYITQYNGNYVLENITLTSNRQNLGNLTIRNSTISTFNNQGDLLIENSTITGTISNTGTLTLDDDVIFGANFGITGNGEVIYNNTTKIAPYLPTYNGNYVLENMTITSSKTNNGNLTIKNCTIQTTITNNGNLTIINSTDNKSLTNNANLTIINSTITGAITNNAQLTLKNSTINSRITNRGGTLTIDDDVTFGTSLTIVNSGNIITSNYSKIFPYLSASYNEATIDLGNYSKEIMNYGKLTIENSTLTGTITNRQIESEIILKNTTTSSTTNRITNLGTLKCINATINSTITNNGILIISDDTILGENFNIYPTSTGEIIINDTQKVADYLSTYYGNIVLTNKSIDKDKTNLENLTLNNCTINATITNNGQIIIDENTTFTPNGKIIGNGEIITDNITRILPYIDTINGNYTVTDTTLDKTYTFNGNVTLENCTITSPENSNHGILNINHCNITVGEDNYFLTNFGKVYITDDTKIDGKIENIDAGEIIDVETYTPKTYIINNRTISYYFELTNGGKTSDRIKPGDTLDFQGKIMGIPTLTDICIDKPLNITSTTKDAYIDLNGSSGDLSGITVANKFMINKEGSYTNVTGIYFHNTQLWLYNTDHVTLDNISAVVEDRTVGSGVGQTSIRANSSYITVKNSYFYTRNNGGSSTLVLAWANYCTIINNTIQGVGNVGNLLYLTTYNVGIANNATYNSYNNLTNNTLIGPETRADICWGIVLSGTNNLVDGNNITFNGVGINAQWGSGTGNGDGDETYNIGGNNICNNKLYGPCDILVGDIIYNNYIENGTLRVTDAIAYNNTATELEIYSGTIINNTITERVTIFRDARNSIIENNTINANFTITSGATNLVFTGNNITGSITLDASNITITGNNITTTEEYTISSKRNCINNVITDNYLLAADKGGDASVSLRHASNKIENNIPITTDIQTAAAKEVTVNTSTPITIILTANDKLLTGQEITITINKGNETITLTNGVTVYNYTPTSTGEENITITYHGLDDYMEKTVTVTITVTPDKDAIIEELNNTAQEQTETINDLNNIINTQDKTIQELEQNLTDANSKIDSLNNNVTNLNNQVKDLTNENKELKDNLTQANNKINAQDKTIQDLNKSLTDANKAIADANKQIKDLNSTVAKLNDQIKNMTTPLDTKVTINTITAVKYNDDVKITGTLTDKTGNAIKNTAVTLNINGKTSNVATDAKGAYTYTGKATKVGTNNVTVQYVASDKYNAAKATSTFKVNKQDLKITINNITSDAYKEDVTVTGVFTDTTGKGLSNTNLNLTINGKTVKVKTTAGGVFTYTTKATKVGTNNVTVSYAGNANYNKVTTKTTFKVVKQDLIVTIDNLDDVRFKENITISGKFVDGNAKPIGNTKLTINLNGKKYTVKTNAQGVYKRSIRVTQIDINNVTVTYNGNANYNKATTKATFKAIKQSLGITLDSVKTANGKITVTGTFTDEESKPLMNSNVKVTINGKTYTAKTNNKGIYTLTKTCTASNITLTLSYAGNKNYNSFTKTTKLTV